MSEHKILLSSSAGTERAVGGIFSHVGNSPQLLNTEVTTGMCLSPKADRLAYLSYVSSFKPDGSYLTVIDRDGLVVRRRLPEVVDPHSLVWDPDEGLVAVSTLNNTVFWLSDDGLISDSWSPGGKGDCWHINSLTWREGVLCATAFGRFSEHRGWAKEGAAEGAGIIFEPRSGKTLVNGLTYPHDPVWLDSSWLVCNSGTGEVLSIDPVGTIVKRVQLDGWTRGVQIESERILVGVTVHRSSPPNARARIAVLDRKTLQEIDSLPVPAKEVFALVAVPEELSEVITKIGGGYTNEFRALANKVPAWINWPKWTGRGWLHKRKVERYLGLRPLGRFLLQTARNPIPINVGNVLGAIQ